MKLASQFRIPVVSIVDTAGALPSPGAEDGGQAQAISQCLQAFQDAKVPIIAILTGEGGSGGALALLGGNIVGALEKSFYNVISPEGGVSILQNSVYGKDTQQMRRDFTQNCELLAKAQKCFAPDILEQGIVEELISMGGSDADCAKNITAFILKHLKNFSTMSPEQLAQQRQKRFESICSFETVENVEKELAKAESIAKSGPERPAKSVQSAQNHKIDADVQKALEFVAKQTLKARETGTLDKVVFNDVHPTFIPLSQK